MPTNYTKKRRIGSVLTSGGPQNAIIAFLQIGDRFLWKDPPLDLNAVTPATVQTTITLTVPTGVSVTAVLNLTVNTASNLAVYLKHMSVNDEAPTTGTTAPLATIFSSGGSDVSGQAQVDTNTSAQITYRANGTDDQFDLVTLGWIDRRGRDD